MRITSYTQLDTYEAQGPYLNVYWDEQAHEPKEGETEPYWTYEMCRAMTLDTYAQLVVKLIRHRYSVDDELAAINDGGERRANFEQYKLTAKALAHGWTNGRVYVPPSRASQIAVVRWEHETGGTMWNGHKVRTDRESQSLVMHAMVLGQPVRWKFADSWADMTPQDMQSLVATVAQHVEACFRREEELQQDPTQDITSGWPAGWV
jgi:hypothetical protein